MKKIFLFTFTVFTLIVGCTSQDDFAIPKFNTLFFAENFEGLSNNVIFEKEGWLNFNEVGSTRWRSRIFSNNGYIEFNTFQSGDLVNIGWAVSPKISANQPNTVLQFKSAQNFVTNDNNKLQVLISNNFDGINVTDATWVELPAIVANSSTTGYLFINSGLIDLSEFTSSDFHIAFKVTGSGTNTALDGLFQVDDVKIFQN